VTAGGSLLWVTNIPTPYRAPLWAELAALQPLTVALLADGEPNREWRVELDLDRYSVVRLHAPVLARPRETAIYAPSPQLLRLISQRPRAVVLDGWESPAYISALWWARRKRVPVIASYRSTQATHRFSRGPIPAARRRFFHAATAVLTAGAASTAAVKAMGVPESRIVEGFNTVDVARFADGAAAVRAGLRPRPGHHFLYVGQLIPRKNVDGLIRAFAEIHDPDDTLTIVGTGPLDADLRKLAADLGVTSEVSFSGHLDGDDLVAAYAAAQTLVLPSHQEVWGLVVNEALAAGLHVVVSDRCGITGSLADEPGVTLCRDTVDAMSRAMKAVRGGNGPPTNQPRLHRRTVTDLAETIMCLVTSTATEARAPQQTDRR
jgi:glycosyltransferase involved in cell wall biosynthesis